MPSQQILEMRTGYVFKNVLVQSAGVSETHFLMPGLLVTQIIAPIAGSSLNFLVPGLAPGYIFQLIGNQCQMLGQFIINSVASQSNLKLPKNTNY